MATQARLIQLSALQTEQIVIQNNQPIEIIGNQVSFWGEGKDLFVYENGQLKAVLQNYYDFFQAAPSLNSSGHYFTVVPTPQAVESSTILASQTSDSFAAAPVYGSSAGWVLGGLLLAGGVAAAAAGGGGKDDDSDEQASKTGDNPNEHNSTVSATDFTGEIVSSKPYFIDVLLTENPVGFLANPSVWQGAGNAIKVTYSFSNSATEHSNGEKEVNGHQYFSDSQKADIRQVMAEYSRYSNITFEEIDSDRDAHFVIYLDDLTSDSGHTEDGLGYAHFGGNVHIHSGIYGDHDAFSASKQIVWSVKDGKLYPYTSGYSVVLHELGHVLGLEHPFDDNEVLKPGWIEKENVDVTTIMTYPTYEKVAELFLPNSKVEYYKDIGIHQKTLGIYDIAALNYLYGVNSSFNSGDNTYTFGKFDYKASGSGAISNVYIADGGGNDTIDASNQKDNVFIDLTSGSWNYVGSKADTLAFNANGEAQQGQLFIGYGSQIENAKGGSGSDTLTGNSADNFLYGYAGNDTINGGDGDDQLEGGQGADILIGGAGADSFIFRSQFDDSLDTIKDFNESDGDRIVLGQSIFSQLTAGAVDANHFVLGEAAADADDYLVFNSSTQQLLYDKDGNGADAAVVIATLDNVSSLSAAQIFVI